ncbi:hypothetical protein A1O3_05017 [Capronia epimyces CBS 606.96]|uniref:Argonaute complex, subunit Arb1 n=1 Tax=Capronia epimyces CBS 606.96 TaxID=1182542 RepID=W9Y406_9EURO|nr:uncharacterized protein A1O3_05017 [Capronia epimyces CBS 606.96]EXJ84350.1 hypothetical protein A1O3_05017 [Capronia epimyces CBS 606.96]
MAEDEDVRREDTSQASYHSRGPAMVTATTNTNDTPRPDLDSRTLPLRPKEGGKSHGRSAAVEDDHDPDHASTRAETETVITGTENGNQIENAEDYDYGEVTDLPPLQPKKKKKRAKRKPQSQRGLGKPTGFEDFFADTPMTPVQHAEEQQLYDADLPFVTRILTAIGRFERTRKMTNERRDVLYKYLIYGGVEVGPNNFQGGQNTEDMDKTQASATLTQASVTDDKLNLGTETSLYEVDFLGCMKGFLSRRAKYLYGLETRDQVSMLTTTLERFMDYLLQHDVCPEYRDDVLATRNLCREVPTELWNVAEATRRLPGDFNIACSTLFGGSYARNYDGETWWGPETTTEDQVFVGMKPDEASQIIHFGVAGAASEDVFAAYLAGLKGGPALEVQWVKEHVGFEITKIIPPTAECKKIYVQNSQHFRPVGRVYAKPWKNPDSLPEDLTPAERASLAENKQQENDGAADEEEYVFLIESILQSYLRVGTRLEATVRKLHSGIMFFDELIDVFPTFDQFLYNELMAGWKTPRPVRGAFDYVEGDYEDEFDGEDKSGEEGEDGGGGKEKDKEKDKGRGTVKGGGEGGGEQ